MPAQRSDFTFSTTLDAVSDLGMDDTGNTSIVSTLENNYGDDTLIEFPPGDYYVGSQADIAGADNFGMEGTGSSHTDAKFIIPDQSGEFRFIQSNSGGAHLFRNFSIDFSSGPAAGCTNYIRHTDGTLFEDIEVLGETPEDGDVGVAILSAECYSSSGEMTIRRVTMKDPSEMPGYPDGTTRMRTGADHTGTIHILDTWLENGGSDGYRATQAPGRLVIDNCFFKNNDNSNVRVSATDGSNPNGDSQVKNTVVVLDDTDLEHGQTTAPTGTSCLRIDDSDNDYAENLVMDNCDFSMISLPQATYGIYEPSFSNHGAFTIQNCRIRHEDSSIESVLIEDSTLTNDDVTFDNCEFNGSGGDIEANGRSGSSIENSCIDMPNASIIGFSTSNNTSSGCTTTTTTRDSSIGAGSPAATSTGMTGVPYPTTATNARYQVGSTGVFGETFVSNVTVLEDHESGTASGLYNDNTANATVNATSALNGSQGLQIDDTFDGLGWDGGDGSTDTTRGNEYRTLVQAPSDTDIDVWFLIGVQDNTNAVDNAYQASLRQGELRVLRRSTANGNSVLGDTNHSLGDTSGVTYQLGIRWDETGVSDNVEAVLYDSGGNELTVASGTDDEHTGGTFGFYTASTADSYWDYITERPL